MKIHGITATTGRRVRITPGRGDVVDAAFLVGLMSLALIGFRTTFSGSNYLVVGCAGLLLGLVLAHLANTLRQPMIAVAAMTVAVFFLLGGVVALRGSTVGGTVPDGATLHLLAAQSVHGWKDLLTTLPPVDGAGPLLVLPYILGLLGSVGGFCLARRTRSALAPVAAPFLVLILVILLGTETPAARVLQGAVFGVVALGWTALRVQRERPAEGGGSGRLMRVATIVTLLIVAAGAAMLVGPHVPGTGSHKRLVLRSYVKPPFDIGQYPSPLAGFRRYTKPANLDYAKTLFTVHGLPVGTPVRIATLDAYNGINWSASNQSPTSSQVPDTFQRVGSQISDPASGRSVSYRVQFASAYQYQVWLPNAGTLDRITFYGAHAANHADFFRYNLATGTGVVPDQWMAGDGLAMHAVLPAHPDLTASDAVTTGSTALADAGDFLRTEATDWAGTSSNPTAQIFALAAHLRAVGKYTDGEAPNQSFLPGHYRKRLTDFVNGPQVAGDDEQFAAAFALMVNDLGTPARVVVGAVPGRGGVVKGKNVEAWVEVQLADGSWRDIPNSLFMNRNTHPTKLPPQQQQKSAGKLVPPPTRGRPHSDLDDASDAAARTVSKSHNAQNEAGAGIAGWVIAAVKWGVSPILILLFLCSVVVGAKALRRQRRRTRGRPALRCSRGWHELIDHARDLGARAPTGTRKEQAAHLPTPEAPGLARIADAHSFGPSDPDEQDAARFWAQIDAARRTMSRDVTRAQRIRAALNLATFRPARGGTA